MPTLPRTPPARFIYDGNSVRDVLEDRVLPLVQHGAEQYPLVHEFAVYGSPGGVVVIRVHQGPSGYLWARGALARKR